MKCKIILERQKGDIEEIEGLSQANTEKLDCIHNGKRIIEDIAEYADCKSSRGKEKMDMIDA